MVCQLNHVIDNIVKSNPNYYHDRKEIISQQTETAFRVFQQSLNADISKAKSSL